MEIFSRGEEISGEICVCNLIKIKNKIDEYGFENGIPEDFVCAFWKLYEAAFSASKPVYKDSDIDSLLETIQIFTQKALSFADAILAECKFCGFKNGKHHPDCDFCM